MTPEKTAGTGPREAQERPPDIPRTLVVTNDFPPRVGGVQQYVWNLVSKLPSDRVAVFAPNWPGWREYDARQPFIVHRWPARFMWPTADLERRIVSLVRAHGAEVVAFTQGLPLPLAGPGLAARKIPYVVMTHGYELWQVRVPGTSSALRRALSSAREVTSISRYTAGFIARVLPEGVPLSLLHPGVDEARFSPAADGAVIRQRHGLEDRPVVLCVSRLVRRKGQDALILGLEVVRVQVPRAVLVLVGDGPYRRGLEDLAREAAAGSVVFTGEVPDEELPAHYAACDVFAMPCRNRWAGLEVEGFGIVYLEAQAAGKPVVAGRSGGAGEAIADGKTGLLVEGREPKAVALGVASILREPALAHRMGAAGRFRVEAEFTWGRQAMRLAEILRRAAG